MAVSSPVASTYNTRPRRKPSIGALATLTAMKSQSPKIDDSGRSTKRVKLDKRDVFTPPTSPEAIDTAQEEEYDDPILAGIVDFMERCGMPSVCSREISEGLLSEGKVQLVGATPSTIVDAAIKQYLKRSHLVNKPTLIQKVNDPRFPRRTLYHLASVDPFSEPKPRIMPDVHIIDTVRSITKQSSSTVAESDDESLDDMDVLSNDAQGPFSAPPEERKRMSLSPSPEIEFTLAIEDAKRAVRNLATSEQASAKDTLPPRVNIALPPSPFITPQHSDEEQDQVSGLKLPAVLANSPFTHSRDYFDDFHDVEVQSPEHVTLHELDDLLDFC